MFDYSDIDSPLESPLIIFLSYWMLRGLIVCWNIMILIPLVKKEDSILNLFE